MEEMRPIVEVVVPVEFVADGGAGSMGGQYPRGCL